MRGRLIRPAFVDLYPIDTEGTAADPGIAGLSSGYLNAWGEPGTIEDAFGKVQTLRQNGDLVRLPAQVEVNRYTALQAATVGQDRSTLMKLAFHFRDLEDCDLIDDTGNALINAGDQLIAMYDMDENLVCYFRDPPIWAKEPRAYGVGLGGARNLLVVEFGTRDIGRQSA